MTVTTAAVRARPVLWPAAALVLGMLALATRRVDTWAVVVTAAVGISGLLVAVPATVRAPARTWMAAVAVGCAGFAFVRWGWTAPAFPFTAAAAMASTVAAVAEEAFFRRAMFGRLQALGPPVAIGLTAVAFALVHAHAYGWGVVPINVAAGVVFGWQRWVTGGWTAPAATHVFANLIQMG